MDLMCSVFLLYTAVLCEGFLLTAGDPAGCQDFTQVTQELWTNDQDRLSRDDVTLSFQAQLEDKRNIEDKSPGKLFAHVNESQLTSPVYATFLALLDNYDPVKGEPEVVTAEETAEEEAFFDAILSTVTLQTLYDYLLCEGKVEDLAGLRALLRRIWFGLYPRSGKSTVLDTSGFEHVLVGEFKSTGSVNGLHNWLAFYEKEKSNDIDYYGHTCDVHHDTVCAAYDWDGRKKRMSTFFLRVSPAYDMAIYSLCYVMRRGTCHVIVDGQEMDIRTYSKEGHIATAFVSV